MNDILNCDNLSKAVKNIEKERVVSSLSSTLEAPYGRVK